MRTVYALVDCNNFYVSCERLFRPDLRATPVVVLSNNDGCIVSRSNEAKALGIGMGEPYFKIRDMIEPHGIEVFSSNYALYGNISARVVSVLRELAPRMEVYSIDESFLDLTGFHRPLAAYGRFIKAEVERLTGMPVGVGISTTKTLTKLANWAAKKRSQSGVVVATRPEQQVALLKAAPVGEVWGIGRKMQCHLTALNITTAWDLAQQDAKSMRKLFSVVVEKTIRELRGEACYGLDDGPEPKQMIACSRSFSERVTELPALREAVASYASRAAEKLRGQGDLCQLLQVYIRTGVFNPDEPRYSRTASVPLTTPSNDTRDLVHAALAGLASIYQPGYRYQKAGVVLMNLTSPKHIQPDLFAPAPRPSTDALMATMDRINANMGRGTVRLARVPASAGWAMKQQLRSPGYTSRWAELPRTL
ncbi:translesion error-prone DNA polymerase V subunit UmuC [Pseudomonas lalucatii]|uniref:Translesion error-prone DNA polymerase V subunit UmuC n=1 Tax=Pseudomonas lalucatii TaxID=1424203 RepID=A0ABS5PWU2_9PSED|nr:translesion error-prone DNA polymerase V subunit UmuC [Pseudomonas lalucatii]MBS7660543.1 translesion error-prone DNA polymerase V subunit UmuC [Pseudomonas lalucatii]